MWIMVLLAAIILVACLHMHWAILLIAALIVINGLAFGWTRGGSKQEY